jgi:hypothetical protein
VLKTTNLDRNICYAIEYVFFCFEANLYSANQNSAKQIDKPYVIISPKEFFFPNKKNIRFLKAAWFNLKMLEEPLKLSTSSKPHLLRITKNCTQY